LASPHLAGDNARIRETRDFPGILDRAYEHASVLIDCPGTLAYLLPTPPGAAAKAIGVGLRFAKYMRDGLDMDYAVFLPYKEVSPCWS
jgi:hypothetical protein